MIYIFNLQAWQDFFAAFPFLWPLSAAFLGAVFASFTGVVVDRLPIAVSWDREHDFHYHPDQLSFPSIAVEPVNLRTPSRCFACGTRLNFLALVPVFGWLYYQGKCFNCKTPIPFKYPLIELMCALCSVFISLWFGVTFVGICSLCLFWTFVALSWMDFKEHWLMDRLTIPIIILGLILSPFEPDLEFRIYGMALAVFSLWACFAFLGWKRKEDLMMGGDLMLIAGAGAWLGLTLIPSFLFFTGVVYGLYTIPQRIRGELWAPFGPALCGGMFICIFFKHYLYLNVY